MLQQLVNCFLQSSEGILAFIHKLVVSSKDMLVKTGKYLEDRPCIIFKLTKKTACTRLKNIAKLDFFRGPQKPPLGISNTVLSLISAPGACKIQMKNLNFSLFDKHSY